MSLMDRIFSRGVAKENQVPQRPEKEETVLLPEEFDIETEGLEDDPDEENAEQIGARRADFSHRIKEMVQAERYDQALELIEVEKAIHLGKITAESEEDVPGFSGPIRDEIDFLNDLKKKVVEMQ